MSSPGGKGLAVILQSPHQCLLLSNAPWRLQLWVDWLWVFLWCLQGGCRSVIIYFLMCPYHVSLPFSPRFPQSGPYPSLLGFIFFPFPCLCFVPVTSHFIIRPSSFILVIFTINQMFIKSQILSLHFRVYLFFLVDNKSQSGLLFARIWNIMQSLGNYF